ncbi:bacteriorhodopsin [Fibrella sp. HMF5335]|uniref:Bacteriorhodopsin n=1 Tax=Fibrella rubiginis TaxID=2817060 RepID=A0A939GA73_9BACT|nr:bacteriorhodopsin-like [Fibrella rubiginis]MBO0935134.1 bacteriorhodopsin [Fibrella rubiginis]
MQTLLQFASVLVADLAAGDVVGFTFFTGYMAMLAASIFFFMERSQVDGKWKTSLVVSGLITFIAAVHYFYMRGVWLETHTSPTQFRYIDWTLTVPLMCVEFYLLIKPYGGKASTLYKLVAYSLLMLVAGYIGEAIHPEQTILWGIISTVGYLGVIYEATAGDVKKVADASSNPEVSKAVRLLRNFAIVGWAIYPIGYMTMSGNLLSGMGLNLDLIYNIADAVNKIGFGLVVYSAAMASTQNERSLESAISERIMSGQTAGRAAKV